MKVEVVPQRLMSHASLVPLLCCVASGSSYPTEPLATVDLVQESKAQKRAKQFSRV